MTPDELRALADALPEGVHWSDPITPDMLAEAIRRFCADAKPVAWMHPDGRVVPAATMEQAHLDGGAMQSSLRDYTIPLYAHPAPAAPQAEPKPTPASGNDLNVYKEMADNYRNDEPTGAPYGIIDPDYGRVYTIARKLAWEEGYAIGLHGSFTRDLDLIAVPWAERACEAEHLIRRIVDATGLKLRDGVAVKPHGRRAWTLLFPTFGDPRFVDLSVMPRIGGSDE